MICKKCNNPFPYRVWIDGKKKYMQHRKFCLDCSPFGSHNTRDLVSNSTSKVCLDCGNPLKTNRRNYCNSCNVIKWRTRTKQKLVDYKGGGCRICGYNRCLPNLIFHHLDPTEKDFCISGMSIGVEKLKVEVDKCVLLCCRCHGEVHAGIVQIPL
jgi:hypothetical protein